MLKFYKTFEEESLEALFPIFVLYYKLGNNEKAKSYLDKSNPHFIKFFKETMKKNQDIPDGVYSRGDSSEVITCIRKSIFLIHTVPVLDKYVLNNYKN